MPVYAPHKMRYTLTYNEGTKDYKPNHIAVVDIPSHIMRELGLWNLEDCVERYTLTYNEGTLSIYAAFSRLKHIVVQIAQMSF